MHIFKGIIEKHKNNILLGIQIRLPWFRAQLRQAVLLHVVMNNSLAIAKAFFSAMTTEVH